jgi:CPA1 family monovalent cation:H+ antiporter
MEHHSVLAAPIILAFSLLALATFAFGSFRHRIIPFTVLLVILGAGLRYLATHVPGFEHYQEFELNPEVVFFLLLPALIFESSYNMRARELVENISWILLLAVPALVLSSALIAVGVWQFCGIPIAVAVVFGALISATDPVAVVSLFKKLGAPKRLNVLVEGESLLNDGTALVLFGIAVEVVLKGEFGAGTFVAGLWSFAVVALGGIAVGLVLGVVTSRIIHLLSGGEIVSLSFTLVVAYLGFIISEHYLHLSGVMTTVAAALMMGTLAPTVIKPDAREQVESFWEFAVYVSNSLLFILLGLSLDVPHLVRDSLVDVGIVVLFVMVARALLVYLLVPWLGKLLHIEQVSFAYKTIMFWGGLKGGLAIAMVLSLPHEFPHRDELMILTSGVVLFTLLVNATTIQFLMQIFRLNEPLLREKLELQTALDDLDHIAQECVTSFRSEGYLSDESEVEVREDSHLSHGHLGDWAIDNPTEDERRLIALQHALQVEKKAYQELYEQGVVPEFLAIGLKGDVNDREQRLEELSFLANFSALGDEFIPRPVHGLFRFEKVITQLLRRSVLLEPLLEKYQQLRLCREVEYLNAASMAFHRVLDELLEHLHDPVSEDVRDFYMQLEATTRQRLAELKDQFPKFIESVEKHLISSTTINVQRTRLKKLLHEGEISSKPYHALMRRLNQQLSEIQKNPPHAPKPQRAPLLAKNELLRHLDPADLERLAKRCRMLYYLEGDDIIIRGEKGRSMFVIVNGQVEVLSEHDRRAAVLSSGEFFGEAAILHDLPRNATVRALSICTVLQISRADILEAAQNYSDLRELLEETSTSRAPKTMMSMPMVNIPDGGAAGSEDAPNDQKD